MEAAGSQPTTGADDGNSGEAVQNVCETTTSAGTVMKNKAIKKNEFVDNTAAGYPPSNNSIPKKNPAKFIPRKRWENKSDHTVYWNSNLASDDSAKRLYFEDSVKAKNKDERQVEWTNQPKNVSDTKNRRLPANTSDDSIPKQPLRKYEYPRKKQPTNKKFMLRISTTENGRVVEIKNEEELSHRNKLELPSNNSSHSKAHDDAKSSKPFRGNLPAEACKVRASEQGKPYSDFNQQQKSVRRNINKGANKNKEGESLSSQGTKLVNEQNVSSKVKDCRKPRPNAGQYYHEESSTSDLTNSLKDMKLSSRGSNESAHPNDNALMKLISDVSQQQLEQQHLLQELNFRLARREYLPEMNHSTLYPQPRAIPARLDEAPLHLAPISQVPLDSQYACAPDLNMLPSVIQGVKSNKHRSYLGSDYRLEMNSGVICPRSTTQEIFPPSYPPANLHKHNPFSNNGAAFHYEHPQGNIHSVPDNTSYTWDFPKSLLPRY